VSRVERRESRASSICDTVRADATLSPRAGGSDLPPEPLRVLATTTALLTAPWLARDSFEMRPRLALYSSTLTRRVPPDTLRASSGLRRTTPTTCAQTFVNQPESDSFLEELTRCEVVRVALVYPAVAGAVARWRTWIRAAAGGNASFP